MAAEKAAMYKWVDSVELNKVLSVIAEESEPSDSDRKESKVSEEFDMVIPKELTVSEEEKYEYFDEKEGVQRNLIIHHQSKKLLAEKIKILQTQTELNDLIIEKWKEDEKKHISKNPQDYIERG